MVTKNFPDEDAENNDKPNQNSGAENSQHVTKKLPTVPAFESSDEDDFNEIRQAIIDKDARNAESDDVGSSDPFYDLPGDPTLHQDDSNPQPEVKKAGFNSSDPALDGMGTSHGEPTDYPSQKFSPFDDDNVGLPNQQASTSPDASDDGTGQEQPNTQSARTWNQIYEQDLSGDDLTQRINALRPGTTQQAPNSTSTTAPFVIEDNFKSAVEKDNLTDKIRNGSVPPETLQLLITKSMSESEVTSVAKELGINWGLTPGKNREEKTQFLIDYFKNKEYGQIQEPDGEADTSKPQIFAESIEDDWRDSDSRLQALQQSLNIPASPILTKKVPLFSRLKDDIEQSGSLAKGLTIGLSIFAVLLTAIIAYFLFTLNNKAPVVTTTPISTLHPFPTLVQLPGGWTFDLNIGTVQDGNWKPSSAEWLQGTEICRLVSLPWNKQLDAIFPTFSAGDEILLTMSNKDLLRYKVEATKTIKSDELDQLVNRDTPCLVVVLTQNETDVRQVIIALPDYSTKIGTTIVTVTTKPNLSTTPGAIPIITP